MVRLVNEGGLLPSTIRVLSHSLHKLVLLLYTLRRLFLFTLPTLTILRVIRENKADDKKMKGTVGTCDLSSVSLCLFIY